ncbi:MAG: hypothetical protein P8H31_06980 [Porticoccaceae bacterium]|nr:hypothetical protein [Porticoccaceae bacterium]
MTAFFKNTYFLLPIIYWLGALLESGDALIRDAWFGMPFFALGIYFLFKKNISNKFLSCAYLAHVLFDLLYLVLIKESYMLNFYEEICIVYDLAVGIILLNLRKSQK